jgi:Dyp-type peroxidase family
LVFILAENSGFLLEKNKMTIDLKCPLDDTMLDDSVKGFMQNLQANILKNHGREHVAMIFLSIKNVEKAREFFCDYDVTDALTQYEEAAKYRKKGTPGGVVRLAFLSKTGLEKFGHGSKFNDFGAFSGGMAKDTLVLDDGSTQSWQTELKQSHDVMLLIAYHIEVNLSRIVGNLVDDFAADDSPFDVMFIQEGRAYKNGDGEGIEHFGYVDGRSQPLMTQSAIATEKNQRGGGIDQYDPTAPLGQFFIPDPLETNGFGSFFVFRKLEQNVAGFKRTEEALGEILGLKGADAERAGAMVVGRFEDGTPVTLHKAENGVPVLNNFTYDNDAKGSKCPFHAHIRKSNPRGSSPGGLDFDKSVQMARRGITYGIRLQHPDTKEFIDKPNDGVGLLFMSYQASIEAQFQFMQSSWVNNEGFPKPNTGIDPVIGENGKQPQNWFPGYDSTEYPKPSLFQGFVTLKGGEYYYTPSISGLRNL